jgi:hypothetical protein
LTLKLVYIRASIDNSFTPFGRDVTATLGFHSVYFLLGDAGQNGDGLQTGQLLSAAGTGFRPTCQTWNIEFVSKQIFTNRFVLIR